MIAYIEGPIIFTEPNAIIISNQGVGYHIIVPKNDLENYSTGQSVNLYIYTHVKEDALELYGFQSHEHKQFFCLLISVSHVGPKLALAILSTLLPEKLALAIQEKNITLLSSISGVGKKTAERISLELKDKVVKLSFTSSPTISDHSISTSLKLAIRGLGYSKDQSERALLSLSQEELTSLSLETLIKKSLNVLTSGPK